MQPISTELLSIIILIFVVIAIYVFFKNKAKEKNQAPPRQKQKEAFEDKHEKPAIVAAIAMMLEGKQFKIKNIVPAVKMEKVSFWRTFGRQEIMRRRMNMHE